MEFTTAQLDYSQFPAPNSFELTLSLGPNTGTSTDMYYLGHIVVIMVTFFSYKSLGDL